MQIHVNGELREVPEGVSVLGLLRSLEIDPARVAVEVDRLIVKSERWEQYLLNPGSKVEIVMFVGGG